MTIGELLQAQGLQSLEKVAVVTLATEGYTAERSKILMAAVKPVMRTCRSESTAPRYMMVKGGNPSENVKMTGIDIATYMREAAEKDALEPFILDALAGRTVIAGHNACKFLRPFMKVYMPRHTTGWQFLDTMVLSRVYWHKMHKLGKSETVNSFMTACQELSYPKVPEVGLESMLDEAGIARLWPEHPFTPLVKAEQTAELVRWLWQQEI